MPSHKKRKDEELSNEPLDEGSDSSISEFESGSEVEDSQEEQIISPEEKKLLLAQDYLIRMGYHSSADLAKLVATELAIQEAPHTNREDVKKFQFGELKLIAKFRNESSISIAVTPDQRFIYVGLDRGRVVRADLVTDTRREILKAGVGKLYALKLCMGGSMLVCAGQSGKIECYSTAEDEAKLVHVFVGHQGPVYTLDSIGEVLFSAGADKMLASWNCLTKTKNQFDYGHTDLVYKISAISRINVLTAGQDNSIRYWNLRSRKHAIFATNVGMETVCAFGSKSFLCGTFYGSLLLYEIANKRPLAELKLDNGCAITEICVLENANVAIIGSERGLLASVCVNLESPRKLQVLDQKQLEGCITGLVVDEVNKKLIVSRARSHKLGRWHVSKNMRGCVSVIEFLIE